MLPPSELEVKGFNKAKAARNVNEQKQKAKAKKKWLTHKYSNDIVTVKNVIESNGTETCEHS